MGDLLLVRGGQRVGERQGELEEPRERQALGGDQRIERLPLDQLHRQEAHAVGFLGRVDRDDVRVIERGDGARFTGEALEARRDRSAMSGGQHLERDVAAQPRIVRAIHLAHSAFAKLRDDFVGPDSGAYPHSPHFGFGAIAP